MGLLRTAIIGAAVYGAYKYLTKPDETGRTKLDDLTDQAPEWIEKAKATAAKYTDQFEGRQFWEQPNK